MRKKLAAYSIATSLLMGTTLGAEDLLKGSDEEALATVISQIAEENGVNEKDERGNTPLHLAIDEGRHKDVHRLIRAGANPNAAMPVAGGGSAFRGAHLDKHYRYSESVIRCRRQCKFS